MSLVNLLLLGLSLTLETVKNIFSNKFSKNMLNSDADVYKFTFLSYIGSFLVLLFFGKSEFSLFTCFTAFMFALVVTLNQVFFLKALALGSMSFTSFVQGSGLIIPTFFGILVLKEELKVLQVGMLCLLIVAMALALNVKKDKVNMKWLFFAFLAMLFLGGIGIIQTVHQISTHSNELITFLRLTFLFSAIMNWPLWRIYEKKQCSSFSIKSNGAFYAATSGAFMGGVHIINLYLAGRMPKVFFFPVANGGLIFITLLSALIFFKERLTKQQWVGIILGIIALSLIGL